MKDPDLATRYLENNWQPIEFNSQLVHPMFCADIDVGDIVRVTWISAASPLLQGLGVRMRIPALRRRKGEGGLLRVRGLEHPVESPAHAIWMDTAPTVVELECVKRREGAQLWISNNGKRRTA